MAKEFTAWDRSSQRLGIPNDSLKRIVMAEMYGSAQQGVGCALITEVQKDMGTDDHKPQAFRGKALSLMGREDLIAALSDTLEQLKILKLRNGYLSDLAYINQINAASRTQVGTQ